MNTDKNYHLNNDELFIPNINFRTLLTSFGDEFEHEHDFVEVFYVLSGSIAHYCNNEKEILETGDMFFLRPFVKHYFKRSGACIHRDICFPKNIFVEACNFAGGGYNVYDNFFKPCGYKKIKLGVEDLSFFEKRLSIILQRQTDAQIIPVLINSLAVNVINFFLEKNTPSFITANAPSWFLNFLSLFHKNDVIKNGLPQIKEYFNFSNSYICRCFKKYTGKTMIEYLNEIRLNYAAVLLLSTQLSILDIAESVGFASVGYFNKIFKSRYGITPTTFRNTPPRQGKPETERLKNASHFNPL